ncbi:TetR/AcrR family transcriptional regulator [Streptomyces sp. NPDC040724]|uniref:TetR/AcrR family transcriptional regulator n=1 Tax=Streptomyces sp. NPDC040724 TaxID=3155612 RepID=UPI0033FC51FD
MAGDTGRAAPKRAGRGTYAVGDARRQKILDTAVEHFAQWGFHASSLARISAGCGITQGGLLHHFRGKEDLLLSVLAQSERHDVERLFGEPAASVAAYFTTLVGLAADNERRPGIVRMFNTLVGEAADPGHPAHAYFEQRYARVLGHTVDVLEAGVARGELRPDADCEAAGREVIAVMDGLQIQWVLAPGNVDMPTRLRGFLDRLLRELSAAGTGPPAPAPAPAVSRAQTS